MAMDELSDEHRTHDVVLSPGDILYVPRGYVHETSTASGIFSPKEPHATRIALYLPNEPRMPREQT